MFTWLDGNFFASDAWSAADAIITIATVIGVSYTFFANRNSLAKIDVYFVIDGKRKELYFDLTRKHITRGEVQGLLSNLLKDSKSRYDFEYLSKQDFMNNIFEVQQGKKDCLEIVLSQNELEQFRDDIYKTRGN